MTLCYAPSHVRLYDPMSHRSLGSSVHGIFQVRILPGKKGCHSLLQRNDFRNKHYVSMNRTSTYTDTA